MTEFLEKIKHLAIEIDNQQVDQQAKEIMSIIQTIEKSKFWLKHQIYSAFILIN